MIFASQTFLFGFLPLFFILYLAAGKFFGLRGKNTVLFFMSLIFYAWGEPVYIVLMIYSSVLDYVCGRMIYSADRQGKNGKKKAFLCVSMVGNLALLGVFKYLGFFTQTVNSVFHLSIPVFSLALPVGISFYTFQTMSYSLDVYRGTITPQKNFIYFGAYVAMFPQLIAGPVVRYSDIARELDCRTENLNGFASGARKLICGLAKKVLIANMDCNNRIHVPDILRLLGILRHGDRNGPHDGLQLSGKLQLPLYLPFGYGILAPLAYHDVDVLPGLCIYSARRKPLFSYKMAA